MTIAFSWVGASTSSPPAGNAVAFSWETNATPVGSASGSSSVSGEGLFETIEYNGAAFGSSLVVGASGALFRANGSAIGSSAITAVGATNRGEGLSAGVSTCSGVGATNRGNGTSVGGSVVFANNALAIGNITTQSVVEGETTYLSRFYPGGVFPGYSFDGTNLIIPLSALPGLSAEEANTVTGDWREIFQALLLQLDTRMANFNEATGENSYLLTPLTCDIFNFENWNASSRALGLGCRRRFRVSFNIGFPTPDLIQ